MTTIDLSVETRRARTLRRRLDIDQLDYKRELARLATLGGTQRQLSALLGISQPSLSSALKTAEKVAPPVPGFSGSDPFEIAQRYSLGELTRERLIDELTRWEYADSQQTDGNNDLLFDVPGSFDDVERARDAGLIDGKTYNVILRILAEDSR